MLFRSTIQATTMRCIHDRTAKSCLYHVISWRATPHLFTLHPRQMHAKPRPDCRAVHGLRLQRRRRRLAQAVGKGACCAKAHRTKNESRRARDAGHARHVAQHSAEAVRVWQLDEEKAEAEGEKEECGAP